MSESVDAYNSRFSHLRLRSFASLEDDRRGGGDAWSERSDRGQKHSRTTRDKGLPSYCSLFFPLRAIPSSPFRRGMPRSIRCFAPQNIPPYDSLHAFLRLTNDRRVAPLYKFDLPNQRFGVLLIPHRGRLWCALASCRATTPLSFLNETKCSEESEREVVVAFLSSPPQILRSGVALPRG